mmetsp:Transcript_1066/g.2851  ORF Transcript_1066/g.2851 Transcript_1066/m.2851 type:complete len:218 (+) Transcript_1066:42-695(+)
MGGITQSHGAASRDDAAAELLRRLEQRRLDDADDLLEQLRDGLVLLDLAVAAVLEAVDLVLLLGRRVVLDGGPRALLLDLQAPKRDADVAHLAPVLAPGVPHDPVLLVVLLAPAHDGDDVVDRLQEPFVHGNAALVLEDGRRVDAARNGPARVDLLLHRFLTRNRTVVVDRDLRVISNCRAEAARRRKGRTSPRDVDVATRPVLALADAVLAFRRTS